MRRIGDQRFDIIVPEDKKRIVGRDASDLITEAGVVVRQFAPLEVEKWKDIPVHDKEKMWGALQKRSAKNEENRSKQTIVHAGGSCGFARREYKLAALKDKKLPGMAELWKVTHWSTKKDDWVNEKAGKIYDQAKVDIGSLEGDGV